MDVAAANLIRHVAESLDRRAADLGVFQWTIAPVFGHSGDGDDVLLLLPSSRIEVEFADHSMQIDPANLYPIDQSEPHGARMAEPQGRLLTERTRLLNLIARLADDPGAGRDLSYARVMMQAGILDAAHNQAQHAVGAGNSEAVAGTAP